MEPRTLLLNNAYQPHKILSWQDAITMYFTGKTEIVVSYEGNDNRIAAPSLVMQIPAVMALKRYVKPFKHGVKFSRINVFQRDKFQCQYCGHKFVASDLTFEHVIPRHRGGKTVWENIVASCRPCNGRKAHRTPEEAGMRLLSKPHKPYSLPLTPPVIASGPIPAEWHGYFTGLADHEFSVKVG
jgi:5-methylcytosine-specific restriction endonuclease McrA